MKKYKNGGIAKSVPPVEQRLNPFQGSRPNVPTRSERQPQSLLKPAYYANNGEDLFSRFEKGLLTKEETIGFYKGNIFKYVTRHQDKNGIQDLEKAETYLDQLIKFETQLEDYTNRDIGVGDDPGVEGSV